MDEYATDSAIALIDRLKEARQPLSGEDAMSEAGRKVLLEELITILKHEAGSRTGADIEDVHDMRVAVRRTRSALRLLEPYFRQKAIAGYSRSLRKLARVLGAVRDLDVQIEDLTRFAATSPDHAEGIAGAVALLDARRTTARRALNRLFDRGSYRRFMADYSAFLTTPGKGARALEGDDGHPVRLRYALPELVYRHLGAVRAYSDVIADADATTLHALRIEFKRLRYVVALFSDVMGSSAAEFIEELKAIQDHLGRVNDLAIAHDRIAELIGEFDAQTDAGTIAALHAYSASIDAEGEGLRAGVMLVWNRFNTKKVQRHLALAIAGL
jgi:CHAD domain-containing protein